MESSDLKLQDTERVAVDLEKMDWRMQGEFRMLPMDLRNSLLLDNMQAPMKNRPKKKRKSPDGITTNKLVFSAEQGTNDGIFPSILKLYVPVCRRTATNF